MAGDHHILRPLVIAPLLALDHFDGTNCRVKFRNCQSVKSKLKTHLFKLPNIFSVWTSNKANINNFTSFNNLFHTIITFKHEVSSEQIPFLNTKVFKGLRFIIHKILDVQTRFTPTETFHCTHFSCHPLRVKKGFVKGEALCILRTNSAKQSFEIKKKQF